uniref:Dirigent protein n=1 Tax=Macrostomum lignano TaxID=282301 RepID=A0A1I8FVA2_9PLAT
MLLNRRSYPVLITLVALSLFTMQCSAAPLTRRSPVEPISAEDANWGYFGRTSTEVYGIQSTENPKQFILYFNSSYLQLAENNSAANTGGVLLLGPFDSEHGGSFALAMEFYGEEVQCISNGCYCFLNKTLPEQQFNEGCREIDDVKFFALIYRKFHPASGRRCRKNEEFCLIGATSLKCRVISESHLIRITIH